MGDRGSDAAGYTTPGVCSGCDRPKLSGLSGASIWAGVPAGDRTSRGRAARRAVEADGAGDRCDGPGCGDGDGVDDDHRLDRELRRWYRMSAALSLWLRAIALTRALMSVRVLRAGDDAADVAAEGGTPRAGEDNLEGGTDGPW